MTEPLSVAMGGVVDEGVTTVSGMAGAGVGSCVGAPIDAQCSSTHGAMMGRASGAFGETKVDGGEVGRVGDVVSAGPFAVVAEKDGEGAEALGGAGRGPSGPVLGAVDGCEALSVAGVVVGAGSRR